MRSNTSFPDWMNLSLGIGADGMIGARRNPTQIGNTEIPAFERKYRYLFSLDTDLNRINNPNGETRPLLTVPNVLKIPAPAVSFKKGVPARFHWLYF